MRGRDSAAVYLIASLALLAVVKSSDSQQSELHKYQDLHDAVLLHETIEDDSEAFKKVARFSCSGREPGYYVDLDSNCTIYHVCSGLNDASLTRIKSSFICPTGEIFDTSSRKCQRSADATCSQSFRQPKSLWAYSNAAPQNVPYDELGRKQRPWKSFRLWEQRRREELEMRRRLEQKRRYYNYDDYDDYSSYDPYFYPERRRWPMQRRGGQFLQAKGPETSVKYVPLQTELTELSCFTCCRTRLDAPLIPPAPSPTTTTRRPRPTTRPTYPPNPWVPAVTWRPPMTTTTRRPYPTWVATARPTKRPYPTPSNSDVVPISEIDILDVKKRNPDQNSVWEPAAQPLLRFTAVQEKDYPSNNKAHKDDADNQYSTLEDHEQRLRLSGEEPK